VPQQALALHDNHARPEPDILGPSRHPAAYYREITAVEGCVRPQPQAHGPMPVQLPGAVFRQAVPPRSPWLQPEGTLDHPAAAGDQHPAQHERAGQQHQHRDSRQASRES
jgi:hypothetical protein